MGIGEVEEGEWGGKGVRSDGGRGVVQKATPSLTAATRGKRVRQGRTVVPPGGGKAPLAGRVRHLQ